jgi:hypothetical protein
VSVAKRKVGILVGVRVPRREDLRVIWSQVGSTRILDVLFLKKMCPNRAHEGSNRKRLCGHCDRVSRVRRILLGAAGLARAALAAHPSCRCRGSVWSQALARTQSGFWSERNVA